VTNDCTDHASKTSEAPAHPLLSDWAINQKLEKLEEDYRRDQEKKSAEIQASSSIGNPRVAVILYNVKRLRQYAEDRRVGSRVNAAISQLTKPGQHDRSPVTTKHEKRLYANSLFAVSYGSFQGRPYHKLPSRGVPVSCRLPLAVSAISSFVPVLSPPWLIGDLPPHGPHRADFPQWVLQARLPAPARACVIRGSSSGY
jgi:hypothetical protein